MLFARGGRCIAVSKRAAAQAIAASFVALSAISVYLTAGLEDVAGDFLVIAARLEGRPLLEAHRSTLKIGPTAHRGASLRTRQQLVVALAARAHGAVLLRVAGRTAAFRAAADLTPVRAAAVAALLTGRGAAFLVGAAWIDSATHFVISAITGATSGVALLHRWIRGLPENATHVRASNSDEATFISSLLPMNS